MLELSKQVVKELHFFLQDVSFEFTLRQQVMAIGFWFAFGVLGVLVTPLGAQPTHSDMLVGSERCTWGPAYWCSGLKQSAHCGATTHCIRSVWESNPYPEDDDEVCTKHRVNFSLFKMCSIIYFIKANASLQVCKICKQMVQEARDQLQSNETQV